MKRAILCVAIALALTAPALARDACSLITKDDAVKYLGAGATGGMNGEECVYTRGNSILAVASLTGQHGLDVYNAFKSNKDAKPVPGLGVEAYFDDGTFVAKKGGKVLELDYGTGPQDAKKMNPKVIEIAKLALSRM